MSQTKVAAILDRPPGFISHVNSPHNIYIKMASTFTVDLRVRCVKGIWKVFSVTSQSQKCLMFIYHIKARCASSIHGASSACLATPDAKLLAHRVALKVYDAMQCSHNASLTGSYNEAILLLSSLGSRGSRPPLLPPLPLPPPRPPLSPPSPRSP